VQSVTAVAGWRRVGQRVPVVHEMVGQRVPVVHEMVGQRVPVV
jgi:hypothetical protein